MKYHISQDATHIAYDNSIPGISPIPYNRYHKPYGIHGECPYLCPKCGRHYLIRKVSYEDVPGTPITSVRAENAWLCPNCSYEIPWDGAHPPKEWQSLEQMQNPDHQYG